MKKETIKELYLINELEQKCKMLLNHNIDNEFYDYYFNNNIEWLLENQKKIDEDFNNNIQKLKFDIILNSTLNARANLILKINDIYEFSKYINFVPFIYLKKRTQNKIIKQFNEFINIKDNYLKLQYFESIRRR